MLACSVSWPTWLASTWSMLMPLWMMAPFWIGTPESRLPVMGGWIPMPGGRLVEQAVDDVDLRLDRLQRRQGLAQLHVRAVALWPTSGSG